MPTARSSLYRRHRFPPEVISYAVWLYFRFPLSLRMVEEMLAARGICVTYETVRQWGKKFGKAFADQIRVRAPVAATSGIWMKSWSPSPARRTGCGAPSIRMASARCPGSASKRHARCPAAHEEPLEIRRHAAARDDHGQAPFVWRCEEEDGPSTRTSSAQRAEQSGGEFPPADKATRTDHEAVQISWTCATISIGSRSGIGSLPHSLSRNRHCRLPPRFAPARVRGLARDLQDRRCGLTSPLKKIAFLQPSVRLS